ncbi:MAG: 2-succinyl-5-enolpyruvyl-6-hydroxy-3-cyclohexene-1-carboxylic-acid synthase [Anaerotardibacter sp.]
MGNITQPGQTMALFVSAFVDELVRLGVRDFVVSPGSRSTPLSMTVFERQQLMGDVEVYLDIDERGAAFFALGMAKASAKPTCVICTSGTALANYYPAVMEAETSRVPLIVLSGDRPMRLQKLGAPQTCNQIEAFGSHVKGFWQMSEPQANPETLLQVRQIARESVAAAAPFTLASGPVHLNFPFDEPLKPDFSVEGVFEAGRAEQSAVLPALVEHEQVLFNKNLETIQAFLKSHTTICLCGEGVFQSGISKEERDEQAEILFAWAQQYDIALFADPLSGLRNYEHPAVIDNYDSILSGDEIPYFDTVIRFGRYPISKKTFKLLEWFEHTQIVVDPVDTRDFNSKTTTLVRMNPMDFIVSMVAVDGINQGQENADELGFNTSEPEESALELWAGLNEQTAQRIEAVDEADDDSFEGSYVYALANLMPKDSLLFSAASMSIRALDTFYLKRDNNVTIMSNRGLNGIDGTLSTAFGAAQYFDKTVLLTGDLTCLHDINALALQHEFELRQKVGKKKPKIIVVLLNNHGGAIFDMLPQASDEDYFERLFLTPQKVDFAPIAQGFDVPYEKVASLQEFRRAFYEFGKNEGISFIEIEVPLRGVRQRYSPYQ